MREGNRQSGAARARVAAAVVASMAAPLAAAPLGTLSMPDAAHFGRRGNSGNTFRFFTPAPAGTVRAIHASGTLSAVHPDAWARHLRVQASGGALASGQGYFQFSDVLDFAGALPVAAAILVPGGFDAARTMRFETYSPDSEASVPGLDGRSSLTYAFDDAYAPGAAEWSGALSAGDPAFNRLVRFIDLEPSAVGTAVFHDVQAFHVAATGRYAIAVASGFDSHLSLYAGAFDPAFPLIGAVEVNDEGINVLRRAGFAAVNVDAETNGTGRLDLDLVAGVQYFAVTSSHANGQTGAYTNVIAGQGAVRLGLVPEPALLSGAALLALLARRGRATP